MNQRDEKCPKCGSTDFSIARDMHATRYCLGPYCSYIWLPGENPKLDTVQVPRELWERYKTFVDKCLGWAAMTVSSEQHEIRRETEKAGL